MMDKIKDFFKNLDAKYRYIIFFGVLITVFLIDAFFLMWPQFQKFVNMDKDFKSLTRQISTTKNQIVQYDKFLQDIEIVKQEIETIKDSYYSKDALPVILERISKVADKFEIDIDQLSPDFSEKTVLKEMEDRSYQLVKIRFEADSGYHAFGRFLNFLERDRIFLRASDIKITGAQKPESNSKIQAILNTVLYEIKAE